MRRRLTEQQRDQIAADAHDRYEAGESWEEIAREHELHPGSVRRLVAERRPVSYRRWGQAPVADAAEVLRRREKGESIQAIPDALGCSRTTVATAIERLHRPLSHALRRCARLQTDLPGSAGPTSESGS